LRPIDGFDPPLGSQPARYGWAQLEPLAAAARAAGAAMMTARISRSVSPVVIIAVRLVRSLVLLKFASLGA
jgi:hypothetical protein